MRALVVVLSLALGGCHLLPSATAALRGIAMVSSAIDAAEAGASVYLQRHPSLEADRRVSAALLRARLAASTLASAIAAADTDDASKAKIEALTAYADLVRLLDELGVLSGRPAAGGAETDAPLPHPIHIPTVGAIGAALDRV